MVMKTIIKNEALRFLVLTFGILFLAHCSNRMAENTSLMPTYYDIFDSTMLVRVQEYATKDSSGMQNKNINILAATIEEKYSAEFCECLIESENVLQLTLKSNRNDCFDNPVGYQRFRLTKFKLETKEGSFLNFYTFASIKKDTNRAERMQNFYISEMNNSKEMPNPLLFKKRYNYDFPSWIPFSKRERNSNVTYEFRWKTTLPGSNICFTHIVNRDFNMISGNKPLVYDIAHSFDIKGILLKRQDSLDNKLVRR